MPSYHGGKIVIYVTSGASLEVTISTPPGVSENFTRGGEPVAFPLTITDTAEFDTEFDGEYTLSVKQGDTECATNLGTEAKVVLQFGSLWTCTPGVVAESIVPANFEAPAEVPAPPAPEPAPVAAPAPVDAGVPDTWPTPA